MKKGFATPMYQLLIPIVDTKGCYPGHQRWRRH
jgi:hypothetical protein